jgi:hypothetical protein
MRVCSDVARTRYVCGTCVYGKVESMQIKLQNYI